MILFPFLSFLVLEFPFYPSSSLNYKPVGLEEPSGIAWHPQRGTLFVVGDEGHFAEIDEEGKLVGEVLRLEGGSCERDLEGIAVDPRNGNLLLLREPSWEILSLVPGSAKPQRIWRVPDAPPPCSDALWGLEGITVKGMDPSREGWLVVLVAKQRIPALFIELSLPPTESLESPQLISRKNAPISSVSEILWEQSTETLWVLEGFRGRLHQVTEGMNAGVRLLPFPLAEGMAFTPSGDLWIADDFGGVFRLAWRPAT
ncbi:SdiA-regulated domain-containing protein [bacterium]|nr:SdiA-regulated domain-containing protein [bacterium]